MRLHEWLIVVMGAVGGCVLLGAAALNGLPPGEDVIVVERPGGVEKCAWLSRRRVVLCPALSPQGKAPDTAVVDGSE